MKMEMQDCCTDIIEKIAAEQNKDIGSVLMDAKNVFGPMLERYSVDFLSSGINKGLPRVEAEIPDEVIESYRKLSGVGEDVFSALSLVSFRYARYLQYHESPEDLLRDRVGFVIGCLGMNSCLVDLLYFPELAPHVNVIKAKLEEIRTMDPWDAADIAEDVYLKMMDRIRNTHYGSAPGVLD